MYLNSKKIIVFAALALASVSSPAVFSAEQEIKVELIGAATFDKESEAVLAALQKLLHGLELRNFEKVGECFSKDVIMIDEKNADVIYGKQAVLDKIRNNTLASKDHSAVKKITVRDPFISVKGDTAMVCFQASKEFASEKENKQESLCSEVYEKVNGEWLILKFRSNWKKVN